MNCNIILIILISQIVLKFNFAPITVFFVLLLYYLTIWWLEKSFCFPCRFRQYALLRGHVQIGRSQIFKLDKDLSNTQPWPSLISDKKKNLAPSAEGKELWGSLRRGNQQANWHYANCDYLKFNASASSCEGSFLYHAGLG